MIFALFQPQNDVRTEVNSFPEVGNSPVSKNRSPHGPAKSIVTRPCAVLLLFLGTF